MTNDQLKSIIAEIEDWPKKGVSFKDISPILANHEAFKYVMEQFKKHVGDADVIIGPDARGFLFGMPLAQETNKPFVMVRKPGKLPGQVISEEYDLEYGTNILEMQVNSIKPGQKVVIVDDLFATGGTTDAIIKLVEKQGGIVSNILFVIELTFLNGREKIKDYPVISLVEY